jgi:hypothetical protein
MDKDTAQWAALMGDLALASVACAINIKC